MDIGGKKAIVTGAARGFGYEIARQLCARGGQVFGFDVNEKAIQRDADGIDGLTPLRCDVSNPEDVEQAVEQVWQKSGGIDILVNNAGIMESAPLINIMQRGAERRHSLELWNRVLKVNLTSVFLLTSAVVDRMTMARKKGVVVNISSIAARGNVGQGAYSASKAGVEALTRTWGKELGRMGIRFGAVAPGFCSTEGGDAALEQKLIADWVEKTPLRRQGVAEEIASSVVHIIENDFINGEVLAINGGLVL